MGARIGMEFLFERSTRQLANESSELSTNSLVWTIECIYYSFLVITVA